MNLDIFMNEVGLLCNKYHHEADVLESLIVVRVRCVPSGATALLLLLLGSVCPRLLPILSLRFLPSWRQWYLFRCVRARPPPTLRARLSAAAATAASDSDLPDGLHFARKNSEKCLLRLVNLPVRDPGKVE